MLRQSRLASQPTAAETDAGLPGLWDGPGQALRGGRGARRRGTTIEWAPRSIGAKNTLVAEDAAVVEAAFRERMQVLQPEAYALTPAASGAPSPPRTAHRNSQSINLSAPASKGASQNSGSSANSDGRERRPVCEAPAQPGQGSFALYFPSALYGLWPAALRGPSRPVCAAERPWP